MACTTITPRGARLARSPEAASRARARDERGSDATERIGWGGRGQVVSGCRAVVSITRPLSYASESAREGVAVTGARVSRGRIHARPADASSGPRKVSDHRAHPSRGRPDDTSACPRLIRSHTAVVRLRPRRLAAETARGRDDSRPRQLAVPGHRLPPQPPQPIRSVASLPRSSLARARGHAIAVHEARATTDRCEHDRSATLRAARSGDHAPETPPVVHIRDGVSRRGLRRYRRVLRSIPDVTAVE